MMEKRNIIEEGRTPGLDKQGDADDIESAGVLAFRNRATKLAKTVEVLRTEAKSDVAGIAVLGIILIILMITIGTLSTQVHAKSGPVATNHLAVGKP